MLNKLPISRLLYHPVLHKKFEDGEATFKQLTKYGTKRALHPLNPEYDNIELKKDLEYRIVSIVLEKDKKWAKKTFCEVAT